MREVLLISCALGLNSERSRPAAYRGHPLLLTYLASRFANDPPAILENPSDYGGIHVG